MKYVLSDIHGNKSDWDDILNQINLQPEDELYVLGDVIDRGKYGIDILLEIMAMDNCKMIIGNHEYMMLDALHASYEDNSYMLEGMTDDDLFYQWFRNGGKVTHDAYMILSEDDKNKVINYLQNLPLNYQVECNEKTFILCHAAPEELYDLLSDRLSEPKGFFCVWDRNYIMSLTDQDPNTFIIFGHTPTINLKPVEDNKMTIYQNGSIIGIDTGAAYGPKLGGRLSCIRLDDMKIFYAGE